MKSAALFLLFVAVLAVAGSNFDSRQQWPQCVKNILDQGSCGSCWAFAASECFADRMCIQGDTSLVIASPEPIIDCTKNGCDGNTASTAWEYLINQGTTSCTSSCKSGCAPADSAAHGKPNPCNQGKCDSGAKWTETWKAESYKKLSKGDCNGYMNAISSEGPIQAWFQVYDSFYSFFRSHPTGIYSKNDVSGSYQGNHFVKMIGYGTENGEDYWLFANSWGTSFADGGYFKMQRGIDLCGIETYVYEGKAKGQKRSEPIAINRTEEVDEDHPVAGNWVNQEDLEAEFLQEAAAFATLMLNKNRAGEAPLELKKLVSAQTQVVAGLRIKLRLALHGMNAEVVLFRDIKMAYHLKEFNLFF